MNLSEYTRAELEKMLTSERIDRFLRVLDRRSDYITVIAENFFNPGNVSALVRTIDAVGFYDVNVIEYNNRYKHNEKISRGTEKWVKTVRHKSLDDCFTGLRDRGYKIAYADPAPDNIEIFDVDVSTPLAILFGTEMEGVSDMAKEKADFGFRLPMKGFVESFNVSVSAALTLFTLRNKIEKEIGKEILLGEEKKKELFASWISIHGRGEVKYV